MRIHSVARIQRLLSLILALGFSVSALFAQMTIVNGASFEAGQPLAPDSFATIFGQNLCGQTATGDWVAPGQLPTMLGGCSVQVNGIQAMMAYASPGQINFIVPQNSGPGPGNAVVNTGSGVLNGSMMIGAAGPGIFAMNGMGLGEGAFLHGTTWQRGPFSVTTDGQPTPISIFMTGLDLSMPPTVVIGGVRAQVTFYGNAPGYAGLQQINCILPQGIAGAGQVPVTVVSNGQTSNVTLMTLLPTAAMMEGMPGWGPGMTLRENFRRNHEVSYLAFNPVNNTALVTDENDDAVRVISLTSNATVATITLPSGSEAHGIAVDATGQYAAVALGVNKSVALLDLAQNKAVAVIGTGYYPSHVAFAGTNILVTNGGSSTVSVIDLNSRAVTKTLAVGFGASGIAVAGNLAVVANTQEGSVSRINLTDDTVSTIALPAGSRPHEVAISTETNTAVITDPISNHVFLLDLSTNALTPVDVGTFEGPGAVATNGPLAFVANQMTGEVTVLDLNTGEIATTFPVDPGPRSLAVDLAGNRLLVLCEGTGTLNLIDLTTYTLTTRINAADTDRQGTWELPLISSITPDTAAAGSTFTLTINGVNLQSVNGVEFHNAPGFGPGGGMMGGGMGIGAGLEDSNIDVGNVQVNAAGTQLTATVQINAAASAGMRQIRLETDQGEIMGMMSASLFTVTE